MNTFGLLGSPIYQRTNIVTIQNQKIARRPTCFWAESAIFPRFWAVVMHDLLISPEPFIQKCRSLARAKSLYLDVVDGRVRLAWINDDRADFMEWADAIGLGVSYDMLL
jgi:hypothetical protein